MTRRGLAGLLVEIRQALIGDERAIAFADRLEPIVQKGAGAARIARVRLL